MIIFRPHKGSLHDAMNLKKEFNNIEEMKAHIIDYMYPYCDVLAEDIVLHGNPHDDERIGWKDVMHVCIKGYYEPENKKYVNYIEKYNCPQCIGMCSENYDTE